MESLVNFENDPRITDFAVFWELKLSSVFISDKSNDCVTLEIGWVSPYTFWTEA